MILFYLILPLLSVAAVAPAPGRSLAARRLVYGIALYEGILLAIGLGLGLARRLTPGTYAAATVLAAAALGGATLRSRRRTIRRRSGHAAAWARTRRGSAVVLTGAVLGAAIAVQLTVDALMGTRHWDGLWYHLPRILFWVEQGSFDPWPTPTWQQIGLPVGADVVLGAKLLLGLGWAGTAWVTAVLTLGCIGAVYVVAVDLGLGRWRAATAALLFASFPAVGLRVASLNSDVAAAFPVLAAYVALTRISDTRLAAAAWIVLNAVGVACKPTVGLLAIAVGVAAGLRERDRILRPRNAWPAAAASVAGACAVLASYWPVLRAFGDFVGGEMGRAHAASGLMDLGRNALETTTHWLLEPVGYLLPVAPAVTDAVAERVYGAIRLRLDHGLLGVQTIADWRPMPGPDVGRTGLVPLVAFPIVAAALSPAARRAALLWWAALVALGGLVYAQPWAGRFTIVLLAAYALAWAASRLFARGRARWVLVGLCGVNAAATFALAAAFTWLHWSVQSSRGGRLHYLDAEERVAIARVAGGLPVPVLTGGSPDALLVGPDRAFTFRYVACDRDGAWRLPEHAEAMVVVHDGKEEVYPGQWYGRRGFERCRRASVSKVREELGASGWDLHSQGAKVDVWFARGRAAAADQTARRSPSRTAAQ